MFGSVPSQGQGNETMTDDICRELAGQAKVRWAITSASAAVKRFPNDALCDWHLVDMLEGPDAAAGGRRALQAKIDGGQLEGPVDRAIGCLLGLVVGDALGAPLEFVPVDYSARRPRNSAARPASGKRRGRARAKGIASRAADDQDDAGRDRAALVLSGFHEETASVDGADARVANRFSLKPGQWTDDGSMALCMADSLLFRGQLDPLDLRLRFQLWWRFGYCNAFAADHHRGDRGSIGLGGSISETILEFDRDPQPRTTSGNRHSSGNGSVMRNAPVAIFCRGQPEKAMEAAESQSRTTHVGDEAADAARLLSFFCSRAIEEGRSKAEALECLSEFPAKLYATQCLARGEAEARHVENTGSDVADRNWNWRVDDYRFAASRVEEDPGYAGSYVMDAVAMALHCLHATSSFEDAVLRAANTCGDADTVAAVTGQLAGAVYGASSIPAKWRATVQTWDRGGDICYRAYRLYQSGCAA